MTSRTGKLFEVMLFAVTTLELELATICIRLAWQDLRHYAYKVQLPVFEGSIFPWWAHNSKYPWELFVAAIFLVTARIAFTRRRESGDVVVAHAFLLLMSTAVLLSVMIMVALPYVNCCAR